MWATDPRRPEPSVPIARTESVRQNRARFAMVFHTVNMNTYYRDVPDHVVRSDIGLGFAQTSQFFLSLSLVTNEGVAPRTGARIETPKSALIGLHLQCRPPHGGADRNMFEISSPICRPSRPPHGGADRNRPSTKEAATSARRPPHGGADRNSDMGMLARLMGVAPRTGARIETRCHRADLRRAAVAPRTGARIETAYPHLHRHGRPGRPPHGGADRNQDRASLMS